VKGSSTRTAGQASGQKDCPSIHKTCAYLCLPYASPGVQGVPCTEHVPSVVTPCRSESPVLRLIFGRCKCCATHRVGCQRASCRPTDGRRAWRRGWWRGYCVVAKHCRRGQAAHNVCAASVGDDTRSPREIRQTCRKASGTAGGQVRARQAVCCAVTTAKNDPCGDLHT
jgi:hypothetical protein